MKKFLLALAAVLVAGTVSADQVLNVAGFKGSSTDKNILVEVYNADGVAHTNGSVVVYGANTAYGLAITSTTSASSTLGAGVVYPKTIAANSFGTIMIYGYHPAVKVGEVTAVGSLLGTSTTADVTGVVTGVGTVIARALEVTTSSTTVKALVCPK